MRTVAEEWATYQSEVMPNDAPEVQVIETRRGFYAGAFAVVMLMCDIPDDASEQEVSQIVASMMGECDRFQRSVGTPAEGHAPVTPPAAPRRNIFHHHLDRCTQCRDHPFALCPIGARALAIEATGSAL